MEHPVTQTIVLPVAYVDGILRRIRELNRQSEASGSTDTGAVWELLNDIDEGLAAAVRNATPTSAPTDAPMGPPSYIAHFTGEAWIADHAVPVDDARISYLVTAKEVADAGGPEAHHFDSLIHAGAAPDAVRTWPGPFTITVSPLVDDPDLAPGEGYLFSATFAGQDGEPGVFAAQLAAPSTDVAHAEGRRRLLISHPTASKIASTVTPPALPNGGR